MRHIDTILAELEFDLGFLLLRKMMIATLAQRDAKA
jgi:hypothetical protein